MSDFAAMMPGAPPPIVAVPLSRNEVEKAIVSLSDGEKTALVKIARVYARKRNTPYDYEDLIYEAYTRIIGERRKWPRGEPAVKFIGGVIVSIAWEWRNSVEVNAELEIGDKGTEEQTTMSRIDAKRIIDLFQDDAVAQRLVVAMLEGARGQELTDLSGLTSTEYESKRRKIRRRLERLGAI
jgi:RNA polymerase sigma-70 factor (ECF subfamily)